MKWLFILAGAGMLLAGPARAESPVGVSQVLQPDTLVADSSAVSSPAEDSVVVDKWLIKGQRIELKNELRMISREEVPGLRKWQRQKSARVAMYSTMLLPGLGQLYNGRRIKTILVVGLSTFYMSKIWQEHKNAQKRRLIRDSFPEGSSRWLNENNWVEFHKEHSLDYAWWSGAIWLISALDAYIDAHLYDVRVYKPTLSGNAEDTSYLTVGFNF